MAGEQGRGRLIVAGAIAVVAWVVAAAAAWSHGVATGDATFLANAEGLQLGPYFYLGAKHMVTGYDHLLFLLGVIFFLYRLSHVALYVTLFSIGHSLTLLVGVLGQIHVSPYLVDAVIGLSVVYKAVDNLGGFKTLFGRAPDPRLAVLVFGLFHGFGLSTKLQDLSLSEDGLVPNMLAFNLGVEFGQIAALMLMLVAMAWWRSTASFSRLAVAGNVALMVAGFLLTQYQLVGYFLEGQA